MKPSSDFEFRDSSDTAECDIYKLEEDDQPVPSTQADLNCLTRDLNISKESTKLLSSRIRKKRPLAPGTTSYWYRDYEREFRNLFTFDEASSLVYSNNIADLIEKLGLKYDAMEWRLFIDSSKRSLKVVLLNKGNEYSSIPVKHPIEIKKVSQKHGTSGVCSELLAT